MNKRIYAFDKRVIDGHKISNIKVEIEEAKKENKVLFTEEKPWEVRYDNSYPNVFYDEFEEKFRCYYSTFIYDVSSSKYRREEKINMQYSPREDRIVSLCYAESEDGVNWVKPSLGLVEFNGSKNNNIIGHYLHGTSILLDKDELNPKKRYKLFTKIDYGNYMNYIAVAFSEDGINFGEYIRLHGFNPMADTHNHVIYDKRINKYILVTRTWRDSMRLPCISYSSDFINWSNTIDIMNVSEFDEQIYSMPIFLDGDYILGLASIYHEGDICDHNFDTVDLTLTYSYRFNGWNFIKKKNNFIERGTGSYSNGEFDNGCIFSSPPVKIEDKLYFYYMGGNGQHTNYRETSLARAYIEKGRYAYWTNKRDNLAGELKTNGFIFLDNYFDMDCEIEDDGYIEIELISKEKSDKIIKTKFSKNDKGTVRVSFPYDESRNVYFISFKILNAKIYSIEGKFDNIIKGFDNALFKE